MYGFSSAVGAELTLWVQPWQVVYVQARATLPQMLPVPSFASWASVSAAGSVDDRRLLTVVAATVGVVALEFLVGALRLDLGAMSHSLRAAVAAATLIGSALAIHTVATQGANRSATTPAIEVSAWSYGRARTEVLAAFTHAVYFLLSAFFLAGEALTHWLTAPTAHHTTTAPHSRTLDMLRLAVACGGLVALAPHVPMATAPRSARALHFCAVARHLLCTASQLLVELSQAHFSDADGEPSPLVSLLGSLALAALFAAAMHGPCRAAARILLTTNPYFSVAWDESTCEPDLGPSMTGGQPTAAAWERAQRELATIDGVLEVREQPQWWAVTPGDVVAALKVRVRADLSDAHSMAIVASIHKSLRPFCQRLTVQLEKDVPIDFLLRPFSVAQVQVQG